MASDRALLVTALLRFDRGVVRKLAVEGLKRVADQHWIQDIHSIDDAYRAPIHHNFKLIVRRKVAVAFYLREGTLLVALFRVRLACRWL